MRTLTEIHRKRISKAHKELSLQGKKNFKHTASSIYKIKMASTKYPLLQDKEWLKKKYVDEGMTLLAITNLVGCSATSVVLSALRRVGISTRGHVKGSNHWQWKGGISKGLQKSRCTEKEYVHWRKAIFERDNYICQACGNKGNMEAHHILPIRDFPHLIYALNNGITLCVKCHKKTIKKEYLFIQTYNKRGELLEHLQALLPKTISNQASEGILRKVQRLATESRTDSNVAKSALRETEDIVRPATETCRSRG